MRALLSILCVCLLGLGCKVSSSPEEPAATSQPVVSGNDKPVDVLGAGATFPFPLYSKWISQFQRVNPLVRINYQSIGSGGGIRQITERTVDFGASDAPMTQEEQAKARGRLLHVPTTLGAVVLAYHLPGIAALRLSSEVVAELFLGEIEYWNDPKLAALNPGAVLPKQPVTIVFRSDGSGTTAVLSEYLSNVSPTWQRKVGAGKSVRFPVGLGVKGNEGVAGQVKASPTSLGYAELAYAKQTGLTYASLRNQAGNFTEASLESITAAAASVATALPEDLRISLVNAPGERSYPLASFSYILVYQEQTDRRKGLAVAEFLWWALHDGQQSGPALHYAPLPKEVVDKAEASVRSIRASGQPLLNLR